MISGLTLPAVLRKTERVHSDGSLHRCANSCRKSCELRPSMRRGMSDGRVVGLTRGIDANEQVNMIGLDGQPDDLPTAIRYHLLDDLL